MMTISTEARKILTDMVVASGYDKTKATDVTFTTVSYATTDEMLDNGWAVRVAGAFLRLSPAGFTLGRQLMS